MTVSAPTLRSISKKSRIHGRAVGETLTVSAAGLAVIQQGFYRVRWSKPIPYQNTASMEKCCPVNRDDSHQRQG